MCYILQSCCSSQNDGVYIQLPIALAFSLYSCFLCNSKNGTFLKKAYFLNKKIVHIIDDTFWLMGFKMETLAEKVTVYIICIIYIIFIILTGSY